MYGSVKIAAPDGMVVIGWCIYVRGRHHWGKAGDIKIHESNWLQLEWKRKLYKSHEAAVEAVQQSDKHKEWGDYLIVPVFTYKLTQI